MIFFGWLAFLFFCSSVFLGGPGWGIITWSRSSCGRENNTPVWIIWCPSIVMVIRSRIGWTVPSLYGGIMFPMKPFLARACLVPFGGPWIPGPDNGTQWRKTIPTDRQLWPENGRSLITCWWIRILSLCRSLAITSLRVERDSLLWSWSFVRGVIFRTKWMQARGEPSNLWGLKKKNIPQKTSNFTKTSSQGFAIFNPQKSKSLMLWGLAKTHKRPSILCRSPTGRVPSAKRGVYVAGRDLPWFRCSAAGFHEAHAHNTQHTYMYIESVYTHENLYFLSACSSWWVMSLQGVLNAGIHKPGS